MFTYFHELSKPDSNQEAPESSVTQETTSELTNNACEIPQNDNPGNVTLSKLSEPEKTVFCLCNQEDPSQHTLSFSKRIVSQLCVVTEKILHNISTVSFVEFYGPCFSGMAPLLFVTGALWPQ